MADDNILRTFRSNDPSRRNADLASQSASDPLADLASQHQASDPLAELARLIGQTDPFLEAGRGASHGASPREPQIPHPPQSAAAYDWRRHIERPNYEVMREQPMPAPDTNFAPLAPAAPLTDYADTPEDRDRYRMASPSPMDLAEPQSRREPQFAAPESYPDERGHASAHHHVPEEPEYQDALGDDVYDDPPRRQRSSKLITAIVLVGCAMLGTAGAYGYRTYTSSTDTAAAPVITADATPSKVVPTPADSTSSRSQERFGSGSSEKLVSREEQPVTLQPGSGTPPRVVFPPLAPSAGAPPPVAPATAPPSTGSATEQSDSGAPRPIRTVRIPSDRSDASTRPVPPTTGTTSGSPKAEPMQVPSAKVTPPPRAQRGGTGPLSLDPSSSPETTETSRTQQRVLTPPAPKEAARGPSLASVPPNGGTSGNGGYLVQVSSQRSEADAKSSYRALQAKYSLLKSRQPIVRKAEVGSKGTYYRAFVGPFGSAGEASQFCDQLKSAGGQCLILRN